MSFVSTVRFDENMSNAELTGNDESLRNIELLMTDDTTRVAVVFGWLIMLLIKAV